MEVMASTLPEVVLNPIDIRGADLKEPFQAHTIPALKWWLQCRGISVSASSKKELIIITNCIAGLDRIISFIGFKRSLLKGKLVI